jgi:hypothetical protein
LARCNPAHNPKASGCFRYIGEPNGHAIHGDPVEWGEVMVGLDIGTQNPSGGLPEGTFFDLTGTPECKNQLFSLGRCVRGFHHREKALSYII